MDRDAAALGTAARPRCPRTAGPVTVALRTVKAATSPVAYSGVLRRGDTALVSFYAQFQAGQIPDVTSELLKVAMIHFDCGDILGVALEDGTCCGVRRGDRVRFTRASVLWAESPEPAADPLVDEFLHRAPPARP